MFGQKKQNGRPLFLRGKFKFPIKIFSFILRGKGSRATQGYDMKVFLRKDVEKIGMAGEIIKVNDGFARNFLIPRQLGVEITPDNESFYKKQIKTVDQRKEVIATKTSMLAERVRNLNLIIKRKLHDDGKLYGAINASEIVEALQVEGVSISKSQVLFGKSIKAKGSYEITLKLTANLKPTFKVTVVSE
jgi:large subunit ribosomal protein L9